MRNKRTEMKNKIKKFCKIATKQPQTWINCHYAESKSLFKKTFKITLVRASTNTKQCRFIKNKERKKRKKIKVKKKFTKQTRKTSLEKFILKTRTQPTKRRKNCSRTTSGSSNQLQPASVGGGGGRREGGG